MLYIKISLQTISSLICIKITNAKWGTKFIILLLWFNIYFNISLTSVTKLHPLFRVNINQGTNLPADADALNVTEHDLIHIKTPPHHPWRPRKARTTGANKSIFCLPGSTGSCNMTICPHLWRGCSHRWGSATWEGKGKPNLPSEPAEILKVMSWTSLVAARRPSCPKKLREKVQLLYNLGFLWWKLSDGTRRILLDQTCGTFLIYSDSNCPLEGARHLPEAEGHSSPDRRHLQ